MTDKQEEASQVSKELTPTKNSLGLLAVEYESTSSEDEHKKESKTLNDLEKNKGQQDISNSRDSSQLPNKTTVKSPPRKNEVNLFEFIAKLANTEIPPANTPAKNNLNQSSHTNNLDISDSETVETLSDEDAANSEKVVPRVNFLEYIANLHKVQLPDEVNNLDSLSSANGQEKSNEDSKSSADNGVNKNAENLMKYRTQQSVVELVSSEDSEPDSSSTLDSDSSDSSSSSSSSEDSDDDKDENNSKEDDENSEIQNSAIKKMGKKVEQGEFDNLPPIEDLKISVDEVLCDPVGEVAWFVEQMVVVKPKPEKPTLNLDTVLFLEKGRRVLGHVFDVFGSVQEPHYCVRFNSEEHIKENQVKVGMTVYYCPNSPYTTLVFMSELTKMKATDIADYNEHPEFSDDEKETAYYANLKKPRKPHNNQTNKRKPPSKKYIPKVNYPAQVMHPQQGAVMHAQQGTIMPPQLPPAMSPYSMPNPYMANSPYAFGYQNWPPVQAPYYGNYGPMMPPMGPQMQPNRFPPHDPNAAFVPRPRFPPSSEMIRPQYQYPRPPGNNMGN